MNNPKNKIKINKNLQKTKVIMKQLKNIDYRKYN